jgi:hypothetical protein
VQLGEAVMDGNGIEVIDRAWDFLFWFIALVEAGFLRGWRKLVDLNSQYQLVSLQSLLGLVGCAIGIWRWWESREKKPI